MATAFKTNFRSEVMPDGKVVVYDVPIFAVCEKAGIEFTEGWIDKAVKYHQTRGDGTAWVMHIHHTGEDRPTLPAGAFHNVRKALVKTDDGLSVPGVIADLVFVDEDAARRAKLGQLLWRSPEIPMSAAMGQKPPRFKSLALLDRDAPHNDQLPILTFKTGAVRFRKQPPTAPDGLFAQPDAVLAFAETSDSIYALMEPTVMADLKKPNDVLPFADDEDKKDDAPEAPKSEPSEKKSEGGSSWKGKLEALKACKLTAEDIPDFVAALKELAESLTGEAEAEVEEPVEDIDPNEGGPADPLEEMPMRDTADVIKMREEVIKLSARLEAQEARYKADKAKAEFDAAVSSAASNLATRGIKREKIIAFAERMGGTADAVRAYEDEMTDVVLPRTADFEDHIDFAANHRQDVPDEVMKFQADGPDAYEAALGQFRIWKMQPEDRRNRIPLARWLEINSPAGNPHFATGGNR